MNSDQFDQEFDLERSIQKAWSDGNCEVEPSKSIDDAMDPEAGSMMAIAFGSN